MSFKEFIKELGGDKLEGELVKTIFISLAVSFVLFSMMYIFRLRFLGDVLQEYGYFLFFSFLSYSLLMPTIKQVRAFKGFPCMTGMMIGMTIGMMSGFLAGFFVGATNGMFFGSVFGLVVGMFFGIWKGKCCGVMGVMEGMMAGFMGGLMGAMTAVMTYNDHLRAAGVVSFVVCGSILLGLNYMIYTETKREERLVIEDNFLIMVISSILTIITTWMIVLGPRSILLQ